jgi:hypothetical protein
VNRSLTTIVVLASLATAPGCGTLFCFDLDRCRSVDGDSRPFDTAWWDSGDTTADTPFVPYALYVGGSFGYDPLRNEILPVDYYGSLQPPTIDVQIASLDFFDTYDSRFLCTVRLRDTRPSSGPLVEVGYNLDGFRFEGWGYRLDRANAEATTNCDDWEASWGDPIETVAKWRWGVAVGTMHPEVESVLRDEWNYTAEDLERTFGGSFFWTKLSDETGTPWYPANFGEIDVVDVNMVKQFDVDGNPYRTPVAEVTSAVRGEYVVKPMFGVLAEGLKSTP